MTNYLARALHKKNVATPLEPFELSDLFNYHIAIHPELLDQSDLFNTYRQTDSPFLYM